jgi:FdhD protein
MVIKTVQMGIPILVSRSGFTAWGVDLARRANLTLIGRAKGKRFLALSGAERIVFDADPGYEPDEERRFARKGDRGGAEAETPPDARAATPWACCSPRPRPAHGRWRQEP